LHQLCLICISGGFIRFLYTFRRSEFIVLSFFSLMPIKAQTKILGVAALEGETQSGAL